MPDSIIAKLEALVQQGTQLAPLGGFEFSGFNARLQNKYLDWRKACLTVLDEAGPIGIPLKNKLQTDQNGGYFFQSSAQLVLTVMRELLEKVKASPNLVASAPAAEPEAAPAPPSGTTRVLKPPPKPAGTAPAAQQPAAQQAQPPKAEGGGSKKVYVVGEANDPLRQELSVFLSEIGLEEIVIDRTHGQMLPLDKIQPQEDASAAFFVFNSDDRAYAMFELGHFVGKLGQGNVFVLHMSDVEFPKNVPGVVVKPIVVKLEEASLTIMKELKLKGYKISL